MVLWGVEGKALSAVPLLSCSKTLLLSKCSVNFIYALKFLYAFMVVYISPKSFMGTADIKKVMLLNIGKILSIAIPLS